MKTGIEIITEERARQITAEGWTPEHDAEHSTDELAVAAALYALPAAKRGMDRRIVQMSSTRGLADPNDFHLVQVSVPCGWPWDVECWKPTPGNRIRELAKAGALCAAEIDRLQRKET